MTGHDLFQTAVATLLRHEGGFVDDPSDPGGATRWGVSLRWLLSLEPGLRAELGDVDGDGDVDVEDVRRLPPERAVEIYRREWWDRYDYGSLGGSLLPAKMLELAVNIGPKAAHRCLQRAVRAAGGPRLVEDGVLGPATRKAVAAVPEAQLLAALKSEAAGFYREIIARRPAFERFRKGWLERAYS